MIIKKFRRLALGTLVLISGSTLVWAGSPVREDYKMEKSVLESSFPFEKGAHEIQIGAGYFTSLSPGTEERPNLDFALLSFRYGWMLSTAHPDSLSGNFELLIDVYAAAVTDGPGSLLAGSTLILRYNLIPPGRKLVPYFQIGAGGLYNDVYQERQQRLLGAAFEFNLEAGLGLRYMFSDRCAFFIEGGIRHISNANTSSRNNGLNSVGGIMGVSLFY